MGLNISPSQNLFKVKIPKGFFPTEIKDKYEKYLKVTESNYSTLEDLVTSEIQNFSIPDASINVLTQVDSSTPSFPRNRQSGFDPYRTMDKTFNIQIRHIEGYVTYWAMHETFFYRNDNKRLAVDSVVPNFIVTILSREHAPLFELEFRNIIFQSIPKLTLDYTNPTNQNTNFSCSFKFEEVEPNWGFDPKEKLYTN